MIARDLADEGTFAICNMGLDSPPSQENLAGIIPLLVKLSLVTVKLPLPENEDISIVMRIVSKYRMSMVWLECTKIKPGERKSHAKTLSRWFPRYSFKPAKVLCMREL